MRMKHTEIVLLALGLTSAPALVFAQGTAPQTVAMAEVVSSAQQDSAPVRDERAQKVEALALAMRDRVSIAHDKLGHGVAAAHCRRASEGCDQRIAEFADYLVAAGEKRGLDPWLLAAMAVRESMLDPFAVGGVGELGILQIHPKRPDAKQVRFMRDAKYRKQCRSVAGACQREIVEHAANILEQSLTMCRGRLRSALGAYNSGRCTRSKDYAEHVLKERARLRLTASKLKRKAPVYVMPSPKAGALARNDVPTGREPALVSTVQ